MITLISPAKNLNNDRQNPTNISSQIIFKNEARRLGDILKSLEPESISALMNISSKLSQTVYNYYLDFDLDCYPQPLAKKAILMFHGDVYKNINAHSLTHDQYQFSQTHIKILSGLYGLIRPLDLILPYRLEMSTNIKITGQKLHDFWKEKITTQLNKELANHKNKIIINLASNEYIKAVNQKTIKGKWINVQFKELRNNKYATIGTLAKKARGSMVRYILDNSCDTIESLHGFNHNGYQLNEELTTNNNLIFTRE